MLKRAKCDKRSRQVALLDFDYELGSQGDVGEGWNLSFQRYPVVVGGMCHLNRKSRSAVTSRQLRIVSLDEHQSLLTIFLQTHYSEALGVLH